MPKPKTKSHQSPTLNHRIYTHFHVFLLIPEVQKEIRSIRGSLGIPENGFETQAKADAWLQKCGYDFFEVHAEGFDNSFKGNRLFAEVSQLAKKYKLPHSLIESSYVGLAAYVTHNHISVFNKNWEIIYDVQQSGEKMSWVGLRVFTLLTKQEEKAAMKELKSAQKQHLSGGLVRPMREKKNIEMDTQLLEFLATRTGNPKRIKEYTSQYGETLKKSSKLNPSKETRKKLRKFERENPDSYLVKYDQPLLSAFAKKHKKSPDAVIKSLKRLNKIAIELYGKPITGR